LESRICINVGDKYLRLSKRGQTPQWPASDVTVKSKTDVFEKSQAALAPRQPERGRTQYDQ